LRGDPKQQAVDPFVNRPVEHVEPATRPVERTADVMPLPRTRTVQIIRAGSESTVTFELKSPEAVTRVPLER